MLAIRADWGAVADGAGLVDVASGAEIAFEGATAATLAVQPPVVAIGLTVALVPVLALRLVVAPPVGRVEVAGLAAARMDSPVVLAAAILAVAPLAATSAADAAEADGSAALAAPIIPAVAAAAAFASVDWGFGSLLGEPPPHPTRAVAASHEPAIRRTRAETGVETVCACVMVAAELGAVVDDVLGTSRASLAEDSALPGSLALTANKAAGERSTASS